MSYINTIAAVNKGVIKPMYLIHGEEVYFARRLEQAIVKALLGPEEQEMNLHIINGDPQLQELINLIETVPFFGGRKVIVIRNSGLFCSRKGTGNAAEGDAGDERLLHVLGNFPDYSNIIFMTADKVDRRRKLYKTVEKLGVIAEAASLKAKDIKMWLPEKLHELNRKMAAEAVEYFLTLVSLMPKISLDFLDNELEKTALYTGNKVITKADLLAVLAPIPEISVFAMIDAISRKDTVQALRLFNDQLTAGEHPLKILSLLNRQVRLLWQAKDLLKSGCSSRQIADELGVMPFIGEKLVRQCKGFDEQILKEAVLSLAEADRDLKSGRATGVVLEKIMIAMCR